MGHELLVELARGWMAERYGASVAVQSFSDSEEHRFGARLEVAGRTAALEGAVLFGELVTPPFEARRRMFELEAGKGLKGAFLLWPPPSAEIPTDVPALQRLVEGIRANAAEMAPGEVRDIGLPVTLALRKTAPEGQYITVTGGLSSHWSQMSRFVRGVYQLDSRDIHRLPRDEEFVPEISKRLADLSQSMQVGEWTELPSVDSWTLKRLPEGRGFGVVMAPPEFDPGDGTYLRRTLRRLVREVGGRLQEANVELRIVMLVTAHASIREENIGPSLVGFDPSMYVPIDLFTLAADGEMKAILEPPAGALPWLHMVQV